MISGRDLVFETEAMGIVATYLSLELDLLVVAVRHVPFGQPCLAPEDITCRSACVIDRTKEGGNGVVEKVTAKQA